MTYYMEVEKLHIAYDDTERAISNVSFTVTEGECVGFIGESGSGKSTIALALMGLLPRNANVQGTMMIEGKEVVHNRNECWQSLRWKRLSIVFQNSADVLNPTLTVGEQLVETMKQHRLFEGLEQVVYYLSLVGLNESLAEAYPHELSGGMRQKVLIALGLCCEPECLIVDEPTMALDAVAKREIVTLLQKLQREKGLTLIVISHELPIVQALTTKLYVLYAGEVVEAGPTEALLYEPKHPYTFGLVNASPSLHPFRDLWGIAGEMKRMAEEQCVFYDRCFQKKSTCSAEKPSLQSDKEHQVACLEGGIRPLLTAKNITKIFRTPSKEVVACASSDLTIHTGEIVALIGQSGSGKSTLAEIISGLATADEGTIAFQGERLQPFQQTAKQYGIQHIFQDPFSAMNEQLSVLQIVGEPLQLVLKMKKEQLVLHVKKVLQQVGLPQDDLFLNRKGFQCSGGMRQRLAIARALVLQPTLLVADEITAMLDPSTAANILRMLKGLQMELGFSMLFITHDLALAQKIADRVVVMKDGVLIESGQTTRVLQSPKEDYTKLLVSHLFV